MALLLLGLGFPIMARALAWASPPVAALVQPCSGGLHQVVIANAIASSTTAVLPPSPPVPVAGHTSTLALAGPLTPCERTAAVLARSTLPEVPLSANGSAETLKTPALARIPGARSSDVGDSATKHPDLPAMTVELPTLTVALTPTSSPTAVVYQGREWSGPWLDRIVAEKPVVWGSKEFYGIITVLYCIVTALLVREVLKLRSEE